MIDPITLLVAAVIIVVALLAIASTHLLIEKRRYVNLSHRCTRNMESLGRTNMALMAIESNGVVADGSFGVRCKYCNANDYDSSRIKHPVDCPVGVAMRTRRAMEARQ
jgi:hypothetical protein